MTDAVEKSDIRYVLGGGTMVAPPLEPALYVTATPIGNLSDVTLRALETLAAVDAIVCEDTRITSRLTDRYGIATPLIAYHEHNAERQRPRILADLKSGKSVALVSDAGTPLVSDPGYRLVTETIDAGHKIVPIPGASAAIAGLVGAGLPTDTFLFAGFLPPKSAARRTRLGTLANIPATLIFYEGPQRTAAALRDMAETLGEDRPVVVARELTKMFESFRRGSLAELAAKYSDESAPKGEVTIIVGPQLEQAVDEATIDAMLRERMSAISLSEAVAEVVAETDASRNTVYRRALAIKAGRDAE